MNRYSQIAITAACFAAVAFALPAHAGTSAAAQNFTMTGVGDSEDVILTTNGGQTAEEGAAGRYTGTLNGQAINIFCVDPTHPISVGQSYAANTSYNITAAAGPSNGTYYNGGLASEMTSSDELSGVNTVLTSQQSADRSSEVAWLADTYLNANTATFASGASGSTCLDVNMASINLAIWDIIMDGGDGLSSGNLKVSQTYCSGYDSLTSYYESLANTGALTGSYSDANPYTSKTAVFLQAPQGVSCPDSHAQNYVYESPAQTPAAVPEASPATVIGLGFGGALLAIALRRKSARAASA